MEETFTRSFVVTPSLMEIIRVKANELSTSSESQALRVIIREWAEAKQSEKQAETPTTQPA